MNILFFGSTSDSVTILDQLATHENSSHTGPAHRIVAVVTQPARPIGRKQIITPTPVQIWAAARHIPVHTFASDKLKAWLYEDESLVIGSLRDYNIDVVISASYGQKIPTLVITRARFGGLNVHPSLLPRWRGADPVPWAILAGDTHVGVSVVTLEEAFDSGKVLAQVDYPLSADALPDPVRSHLFQIGAQLLIHTIDKLGSPLNAVIQSTQNAIYAGRMKRQTGFVPWELIAHAVVGTQPSHWEKWSHVALLSIVRARLTAGRDMLPDVLERAIRALTPWPGVWSEVKIKSHKADTHTSSTDTVLVKRIKLLKAHIEHTTPDAHTNTPVAGNRRLVIDIVQLEGRTPVLYKDFLKV